MTNTGGNVVAKWPSGLDFHLLNTGTCIRWQGESIVEHSWVTPATMSHITVLSVIENVEILSGHLYNKIRLHISTHTASNKDTVRTQHFVEQDERGRTSPFSQQQDGLFK